MKTLLRWLYILFLLLGFKAEILSQLVYVDGCVVSFTPGALALSNGGIELSNNAQFTNNGNLTITKNSTFSQAGDFILNNGATAGGNGYYKIEQDWMNDATFNGDNSTVELYGNTQQLITSTTATNTTFNNLLLTGSGSGANRKKSLVSCDIFISSNGLLNLNDRELETQTNTASVINSSLNAVLNNNTFGSEGFVSSLSPGYFIRKTNAVDDYLFPTGSSDGTLRYRPVIISPNGSSINDYAVRLNNFDANNDGFNRSTTDGSINAANSLFYHSIDQISGNEIADFSIFYIPSDDGSWTSTANWKNAWNNILGGSMGNSNNFAFITKNGWNLNSNEHPYILVNMEDQLEIPNVFTPNNDGINDQFLVDAKNLSEFNLVIVNRWGQVVFESNDLNKSWDGKYKNEMCNEGTYFYIATGKSLNDQAYKKQGFVQLEY